MAFWPHRLPIIRPIPDNDSLGRSSSSCCCLVVVSLTAGMRMPSSRKQSQMHGLELNRAGSQRALKVESRAFEVWEKSFGSLSVRCGQQQSRAQWGWDRCTGRVFVATRLLTSPQQRCDDGMLARCERVARKDALRGGCAAPAQ
eukprot:495184-Pleurochrysis_carterae.AAC.1